MGEEVLPARTPVDMPAPEAAFSRFRVLVIGCAELAVLAGVSLFNHITVVLMLSQVGPGSWCRGLCS